MAPLKWWQKAVFYQIYPRSFADGNGDGIGDLKGIIAKLDYLKTLGIDGIWLSPHFPSPQFDCGYDIADYTAVDPDYGTLDEFKTFLQAAHQRGIRVILDLVLNHTSDQHHWFLESRSSRDNPKRDWYIWAGSKASGPPNNWYSTFGGSAWEYDAQTDAYYYHFFFKQQPDLNWRNPQVKEAMFQAIRFWLDMGVDGFRLDAIGTIYEDPDLPDQDSGMTQEALYRMAYAAKTPEELQALAPIWEAMFKYQHDLPEVHDLMHELRALIDAYDDRVLVGETDEIAFYGKGDDELHMIFNFPLLRTQLLSPAWVRANQQIRLSQIPAPGWPCNTLGNHDSPRVYNRFGDGEHNDAWARLNLVLMLTLKGTPFLYNGEEIGMRDYMLENLSQFRDQAGIWFYRLATETGGLPEEEALRLAREQTRDKSRTPTQWANAANAGFSPAGVTTWLPVAPDYASGVNVADQDKDPESLLNFYRKALAMRRENQALISGDYQPVLEDSPAVLAYVRSAPEQRCLVTINMTAVPCAVHLDLHADLHAAATAKFVFSTHARPAGSQDLANLELAPFEAYIAELA